MVHRRGGQLFAVVQGRQDAARARQAAHLRRLHVLLPVAAGHDVPVIQETVVLAVCSSEPELIFTLQIF